MAIPFWHRLRTLVRELGVTTAMVYLLDRLLRGIHPGSHISYYRFVAQPLRQTPRLPAHRGKGFAFGLLQEVAPVLAALGRPAQVLAARFAQGAQCLVASKGQDLAGCIWFVPGVYHEDEVRVDYVLPATGECVWDFDVFVAPSERLGFLFARQWDAFDALLYPLGVRYSVSRINAFNQRSLASHLGLGARDCGWALFVCLGRLQWMLSSLPPYVALGGRPQLRFRIS